MSQNRTRRTVVASAAISLGVALLAAPGMMSSASAHESDTITICRATHDSHHPYETVEVSRESVLHGDHDGNEGHVHDSRGDEHQHQWGDIIPPFTGYEGKNWSEGGRSVHDHGCADEGEPTPAPSTPSEAPSTPSEEPSTPAPAPSTPSEDPSTPAPAPSTPSDESSAPQDLTPVVPVASVAPSTPATTTTEATPTVTPKPTVDAPQVETIPSTGSVDHAAVLPKTGAPVGTMAVLGAGLLAAGAVTLFAGRRRPAADAVTDDTEI